MSEAIIGGVVAAFLWTLIVLIFWAARRRWSYSRLKGDYEARFKGSDEVQWTLKIRVMGRGNRLNVSGRNEAGATFRGDIVMSDELADSGRGHYYRDDAPDAFGFWEVQVVDARTILVHETFADPRNRVAVVTGYMWSRI